MEIKINLGEENRGKIRKGIFYGF